MGSRTKIEWTEATWNPVTGCSKVSAGCANCYAERLSHRFKWTTKPWNAAYAAENVRLHPERLKEPLRWKKPRRVFVCSMADLFHEAVPDWFIRAVFQVMGAARQHTFQVLTKRPTRMQKLLKEWLDEGDFCTITGGTEPPFPWPNVWIGVSVEDQKTADERIPILLATPATLRFVSCEPLLGPIDLSRYLGAGEPGEIGNGRLHNSPSECPTWYDWCNCVLDWVIVGGESGPSARPMNPDWVRSLRDQCEAAGVPVFIKQMGSVWAQDHGGPSKGGDPAYWPEDLRVRKMPEVSVL